MRRVIEYGGTSLATPAHFERAARAIAGLVEVGEQVAVVVSAMGDETDRLLGEMSECCAGSPDAATLLRYLSTGEERSVLMMTAALTTQRINAVPFLPRDKEHWPLIVDSDDASPVAPIKTNEERDFSVRTQKTSNRFHRNVLPRLRLGDVPVIAGFMALSSRDELVTLGRGGSDITAFITGRYIDADEVVIVTDVEGVLSADPRLASNPRILENLSAEDAEIIAGCGVRVVHPRALRFKSADTRVRVIDHRMQDELVKTGTTITGESKASIFRNQSPLAMLVLVGQGWANRPGILGKLAACLGEHDIPINAATCGSKFIVFYLGEDVAEEAHRLLHDIVDAEPQTFTNITLRGGIGEIRLRSGAFIETPGIVADATRVLAHKGINLIEAVTSLSDIHFFLKWDDLDAAYDGLLKLVKTKY